MRIKLTAVLSIVVVYVVSCAAGTGDGDIEPLSNNASGGHTVGSAGGVASVVTPPPASVAVSREVEGSYSLDVACAQVPLIGLCLLSETADKDVTFTLPPRTKRSSIAYVVKPHGPSAGGTVDFASADPHDGTVHMHGFADALSSVHLEVSGVMVVPE